jgi:hypothetical protein
MIYGYAMKELGEDGLLEMKEITFEASAYTLREIALFLTQMAEFMERGGFVNCSHRHIGNTIANWDKRFPHKDIIVIPPPDEMREQPPEVELE